MENEDSPYVDIVAPFIPRGTLLPELISVAAEPVWLEVSRAEVRARKERLSAMMGRLASKQNAAKVELLTESERELLEEIWQMLNQILG